jgi:hypothetical protein
MALCKHDLELSACAACAPRPGMSPPPAGTLRGFFAQPAPAPPSAYGPWFAAGYDGLCAGCGDEFPEGEQIRADGASGWLAQCCGEDEDAPGPGYREKGDY